MNLKNIAEFLAALDKIQIQANPNLTDGQKELCKLCIDKLKNKVQ